MDPLTCTLAELLEAAGWKRQGVCASAWYDLWSDPRDPTGKRWFATAALVEELHRREPGRLPPGAAASTAPAGTPPRPEWGSLFK